MTQRAVEAQTPDGTGQMGNLYSFPDKLPRLSATCRNRINRHLLQKLAQLLGWSRYA